MYQKNGKNWMKHLDFIILDVIILQVALSVGYMIRQGWGLPYLTEEYRKLSLFLLLISVCSGFFLETYEGILRRGYLMELKKTLWYVSVVSALLVLIVFILKESATYSRTILLLMWGIGAIFCYIGRAILKRYIVKMKSGAVVFRALLILTTEDNVQICLNKLKKYEYSGLQPVGIGILGEYSGVQEIEGIPVIGTEEEVFSYLREQVVDEVYIEKPYEMELQIPVERYVDAGLTVHTKIAELNTGEWKNEVENFAGNVVLTTTFKVATPRQLFMKRCLDICGGLVGVVLTGILCIFVGPIIRIQSPGPIFFSQWRVGRNGRKFKIYKFRSMYMDAEERKKELMDQNEMSGFMFKMENDPRIFPFGHFLRNTSLDEFPQFWNVLKGDMSLVGTRPPTVDEFEQYQYYHRKRVSIKPGLTGMWQVSGRSDITDFEEVVKLDTQYIADWRLASDIKILWKTVEVVLLQKGSR